MDDQVHVKRVVAFAKEVSGFRFQVEIEAADKTMQIVVSAQELLDFDQFQTAVLEQTGRLVMAPCGPGAEGPDHYRRHRRVWCTELQSAIWDGAYSDGTKPIDRSAGSAIPAPKMLDFKSDSAFRLG